MESLHKGLPRNPGFTRRKARDAIVGAVANDKGERRPEPLHIGASETIPVRAEVGVVVRVAEVVQTPSRWVSEHFPSYFRWLASFDLIVTIMLGFTMIQVEEYAAAMVCWVATLLVIVAKVIIRKEWTTRRKLTLCLAGAAVVTLAIVWTTAKRADRPWSALPRHPPGVPGPGIEQKVHQKVAAVTLKIQDKIREAGTIEQEIRGRFPIVASSTKINTVDRRPLSDFAKRIEDWKSETEAMLKSDLPSSGADTKFATFHPNIDKHRPELYEYGRLVEMRQNLVDILTNVEAYAGRAAKAEGMPASE